MGWIARNTNSTAYVSGGSSLTATLAVTTGDLIVGFGSRGDSGTAPTFSDSATNPWALVLNGTVTDRPSSQSIWCAVAGTTGTITITGACGANIDQIHVANFSHTAGAIPGTVDATGALGAGNQSVVITTTHANTLVVGFGDASGSNAPGTGYTQIAQVTNATNCCSEYQTALSNSAGSITVALNEGVMRGILAAAFIAPVGSGSNKLLTMGVG